MAIAVNLFSATVPSSVGSNNVIFGPGLNGNSHLTTDGAGVLSVGVTANFGADDANYITASGASSGSAPLLSLVGTDTNIALQIADKGTGGVLIVSNSHNALFIQTTQNNTVNYFQMGANTTGNPPFISSIGSDTNIDLQLSPQGSGVLLLTGGSFTANGAVATALTSIGPTGSHTTVQEWLTIKNGSGVVRYVPCF